MTARLLEGRPAADQIWQSVEQRAALLAERLGRQPRLAILRGEDPAASAYARQIEKAFSRRGLSVSTAGASSTEALLRAQVRTLNEDESVDGILLMAPLGENLPINTVVLDLDPTKDVDGLHPLNLGWLAQRREGAAAPATAMGGIRLLEHHGIPLRGSRVVVVGRSSVVGLPLALLLVARDATVSVCHTRTPDLAEETSRADILCVAAGRAGLIGPAHVRRGSAVVDFGINETAEGRLVGDVLTDEVAEVAEWVTPVPGGTGPVTVAVLAEQTVVAAERRRGGS